jgi:hypothetical protein
MSVNVVVDLGVNTNTSGTIQVFGQNMPSIYNKVVAATKMDYRLLYHGPGTALFEFQGQDNDITARTVSEFTLNLDNKPAMAAALQSILTGGNLDATAAIPFSNLNNPFNPAMGLKYADPGYRNFATIGELALGCYSHVFFGHVDATAAVSNDTTFITKMNGTNESASEANLSGKLANLIYGLGVAQATTIAKQVIGQDASRAFGADNDNQGVDGWQKLAFKPGDKIYVSITLVPPTITVQNGQNIQFNANNFWMSGQKYMIEITLEDPTELVY